LTQGGLVENDAFVSFPRWQSTVNFMNHTQKSSLRTWKTLIQQELIEPFNFGLIYLKTNILIQSFMNYQFIWFHIQRFLNLLISSN
jgi:hypothetical protein